jgi:hypothetical protein
LQYGLVLAYAAIFLYKAKFVVLVYYGDFCVIVINGWMTKKVFMETVQYQTLLDCAHAYSCAGALILNKEKTNINIL